jgi:replication-associated recombination protein RarA
MNLYEKYRPATFDDVIGQDKAVQTIRRITNRGWGGQAFWISGASGTGKTTLARIIAGIGADEWCIEEYDSADKLDTAALDKLDIELGMYGWGKGGRAIIVNEAHGLRALTVRRLLGLLERIPRHVVWIFTTTREGEQKLFDDQMDASPLISRCVEIRLTNQGLCKPFAARAQAIAQAEHLDGKPLAAYETLAKSCKNNMRMMLQQIAAGVMAE